MVNYLLFTEYYTCSVNIKNCVECNQYKYIEKNGKCRDCCEIKVSVQSSFHQMKNYLEIAIEDDSDTFESVGYISDSDYHFMLGNSLLVLDSETRDEVDEIKNIDRFDTYADLLEEVSSRI